MDFSKTQYEHLSYGGRAILLKVVLYKPSQPISWAPSNFLNEFAKILRWRWTTGGEITSTGRRYTRISGKRFGIANLKVVLVLDKWETSMRQC